MILYALIARVKDAAVLIDACSPDVKGGNAPQVTVMLLEYLKENPDSMQDGQYKTLRQVNNQQGGEDFLSLFTQACTIALGEDMLEFFFHLYLKDSIIYCALSDDSGIREQQAHFQFLDSLQIEFLKMYRIGRISRANAYDKAMQNNFTPTLNSLLHYHTLNIHKLIVDPRVQARQAQIEDVHKKMRVNINIILENMTKYEQLIQASDSMSQDAEIFRKKSTRLKQTQQQKLICWTISLGLLVLLVIYLAVVGVCGLGYQNCRQGENSNSNSNN
jgi:hypothetical protein